EAIRARAGGRGGCGGGRGDLGASPSDIAAVAEAIGGAARTADGVDQGTGRMQLRFGGAHIRPLVDQFRRQADGQILRQLQRGELKLLGWLLARKSADQWQIPVLAGKVDASRA